MCERLDEYSRYNIKWLNLETKKQNGRTLDAKLH